MFSRLREDIANVLERDPAARSRWEVLTCYPGMHALWLHRFAHLAWTNGFRWVGRFSSHVGRMLTGIEIHPGATIGRRVFIGNLELDLHSELVLLQAFEECPHLRALLSWTLPLATRTRDWKTGCGHQAR